MIILNGKSLLVLNDEVEDNEAFVHGFIYYYDGRIADVGRIKKDQGNFLYDKQYVYRWRMDREFPTVYSIETGEEVLDKEASRNLIMRYKNMLG